MREAFDRWWLAPDDAPAAVDTYLPCGLEANSSSDGSHTDSSRQRGLGATPGCNR